VAKTYFSENGRFSSCKFSDLQNEFADFGLLPQAARLLSGAKIVNLMQ
jgi:hypothetical protein